MPILIVCRASYIRGDSFGSGERADFGACFEVAESLLSVGPRFVRLEAVSIAQYQGRIQHNVVQSSRAASAMPCELT